MVCLCLIQIKLLVNRVRLRTEKNKVLETELQRAKAVLSAVGTKTDLPDCLEGEGLPHTGASSPFNSGDNSGPKSVSLPEEQMQRRIVAMKSVLANHGKSMSASLAKDKKLLRANPVKVWLTFLLSGTFDMQ